MKNRVSYNLINFQNVTTSQLLHSFLKRKETCVCMLNDTLKLFKKYIFVQSRNKNKFLTISLLHWDVRLSSTPAVLLWCSKGVLVQTTILHLFWIQVCTSVPKPECKVLKERILVYLCLYSHNIPLSWLLGSVY